MLQVGATGTNQTNISMFPKLEVSMRGTHSLTFDDIHMLRECEMDLEKILQQSLQVTECQNACISSEWECLDGTVQFFAVILQVPDKWFTSRFKPMYFPSNWNIRRTRKIKTVIS
jgi:hypothetical protein